MSDDSVGDGGLPDDSVGDDSVDDEFEKLISALQFEGDPTARPDVSDTQRRDSTTEDLSEVAEMADLSGEVLPQTKRELGAAPGWISLILSPIDAPRALRAALGLVGAPTTVIQVGYNTAVYLDSQAVGARQEEEDEELLALLGDERPMPPEVDGMARLVSKLAKGGSIAFVAWVKPIDGDDPDELPTVEGTISARRYVGGEPEDPMSAGLVLASLPMEAEELLLGRIRPEDVPDQPKPPWSGWLKGRGRHL